MSLAWATPLSMEPFLVGIAVGKESLTAQNIEETKEFVLNIPTARILKAIWTCGRKSGREVDKFQRTNLTKERAKIVRPPHIRECVGHLECRVRERIDVGECFFFIGEVVKSFAEKGLFPNYWRKGAKVVLHLGGKRFSVL